MIFSNSYSQGKYPCFYRIEPMKTGVFVFHETPCGAGRVTRPLRKKVFAVNLRNKNNYALRIKHYALILFSCQLFQPNVLLVVLKNRRELYYLVYVYYDINCENGQLQHECCDKSYRDGHAPHCYRVTLKAEF